MSQPPKGTRLANTSDYTQDRLIPFDAVEYERLIRVNTMLSIHPNRGCRFNIFYKRLQKF